MSQKLIHILILILLNVFKSNTLTFNPDLYSEPDLDNPLIPKKWREMCGFRHLPKKVKFPHNCSLNKYEDRVLPHPIESFRRIRPIGRVLGGRALEWHESPWTVQITRKAYDSIFGQFYSHDNHHCTGVLITMRHILTAAHCLKSDTYLRIYFGNIHSAQGLNRDDYEFYIHPNYTQLPRGEDWGNFSEYDIGLIVLKTPIDWQKYGLKKDLDQLLINTICLPKAKYFTLLDSFTFSYWNNATIFGWGQPFTGKTSWNLKRGDVVFRYYAKKGNKLFESSYDIKYARMCKGDSGSGLVQYLDDSESRAVLIGINIEIYPGYKEPDKHCTYVYPQKSHSNVVNRHLNWIYDRLAKDPE